MVANRRVVGAVGLEALEAGVVVGEGGIEDGMDRWACELVGQTG